MANDNDIFGIGEAPAQKSAVQDDKTPDALTFFGVVKEDKKEE